jgi:hypothetical protein
MKKFLATFLAVLVLLWAFLLFGGAMIFQNLWALLVFSSLVLTVLILAFESQGEQIEKLEARVQALEQAREHNAGEVIPGEEEEPI